MEEEKVPTFPNLFGLHKLDERARSSHQGGSAQDPTGEPVRAAREFHVDKRNVHMHGLWAEPQQAFGRHHGTLSGNAVPNTDQDAVLPLLPERVFPQAGFRPPQPSLKITRKRRLNGSFKYHNPFPLMSLYDKRLYQKEEDDLAILTAIQPPELMEIDFE